MGRNEKNSSDGSAHFASLPVGLSGRVRAPEENAGTDDKTQQCLKRPERNRKGKTPDSRGRARKSLARVETMTEASGPAGEAYTVDTAISDVISDPVFGDYGRLIFPVDSGYYSGNTLGELQLTWYHNIDPDKTVEIANDLRDRAAAGENGFL